MPHRFAGAALLVFGICAGLRCQIDACGCADPLAGDAIGDGGLGDDLGDMQADRWVEDTGDDVCG